MKRIIHIILLFFIALFVSISPFGIKNILASNTIYDYEIVYQSPYPSYLPADSVTNVYIDLKNTGNINWYKDGPTKIRLGSGSELGAIYQKRDYSSEFANDNWPSQNRASEIVNTQIVKPGEIARFQFDIRAPETIGVHKAYFTPVADGHSWMKDIGIYWEIETRGGEIPKEYLPEMITASTPEDSTEKNEEVAKPKQITTESIIADYSQAVSKLICYDNDAILQQGSGTLIYNESKNPGISEFYIITNRHVVEPSDGTTPNCSIYLYPNGSDYPIKFESIGFKDFEDELDLVTIEPTVIKENGPLNGTRKNLGDLAKSNKSIPLRDFSSENRDLESVVFGYPKNGNLKITKGKLLNIEIYNGVRFIDTLAPVDHGNSGGLAIDSNGYLLGIPTNKAGGIGMILDLEYIINDLGINIL